MTVPLSAKQLVDRLWSYCHVLRHDGVSTIDYVDQLTLLLFLKMADERAGRGLNQERIIPEGLDWQVLLRCSRRRSGDAVHPHPHRAGQADRHAGTDLPEVAEQDPQRGHPAQADRRPHRHAQLVGHRHRHQGRRLRGAAGTRRRGRQVRGRAVLHPASADQGHGRLHATLTGRHDHGPGCRDRRLPARRAPVHPGPPRKHPDPRAADRLAGGAISGVELVDGTARLAQMNLLLHGIGRPTGPEGIEVRDALAEPPRKWATLVLADPPFGRKSGFTNLDEAGRAVRDDDSYGAETSGRRPPTSSSTSCNTSTRCWR